MKKMHIIGAALVALFAFSVFASSASAVTFLLAEWLINGVGLSSILLVESEGELRLINLNALGLGIRSEVSCSGIIDGWVGLDGLDGTSELLNLAGEPISSTVLSGLPLTCTDDDECVNPTVWPDGIPGETLLVLMEDGTESFFVDLLFSAGWYIECTSVFGKISELCEAAETAVQVTNEPGTSTDNTFSDAFQTLAGLSLATCTDGGANSGEVSGLVLTTPDAGNLAASSEG